MTSRGERLLLVDDMEPILFAMRDYLSVSGFHVDIAQTRDSAFSLLDQNRYAAVVADLRLNGERGSEGIEILRYIREQDWPTRVIILTAYGSPDAEREVQALNADAFFHKPKSMPELMETLQRLLREGRGEC